MTAHNPDVIWGPVTGQLSQKDSMPDYGFESKKNKRNLPEKQNKKLHSKNIENELDFKRFVIMVVKTIVLSIHTLRQPVKVAQKSKVSRKKALCVSKEEEDVKLSLST